MSSSASEASQPLITPVSQQSFKSYSATPQLNPTSSSSHFPPASFSAPAASHYAPPPSAAASSATWPTLSCVPWLSGGGSGGGGGDYDNRAMVPTNVVYRNGNRTHYSEWYYHALRFSWPPFVAAACAVFAVQVLLFALANSLLAAHMPAPPSFSELLLLHLGVSAGYGTGPFAVQGSAQHLLLSIEALARTVYFTLVTGILYARFSRPVSRIRFSKSIFVCQQHGVRSLVLRIANDRLESRQPHASPTARCTEPVKLHCLQLAHAVRFSCVLCVCPVINTQVQLIMSMSSTTAEGKPWRHFYHLELARSSIPTFLFPWVLQHRLDAASPLHALTRAQWHAARVDVHCVVSAVDSVFGGNIWARHRYDHTDVRFGWRPVDVFQNMHADVWQRSGLEGGQQQGMRVIDMALFDEAERDESDRQDWDEEAKAKER